VAAIGHFSDDLVGVSACKREKKNAIVHRVELGVSSRY